MEASVSFVLAPFTLFLLIRTVANKLYNSEEEDPDDYPFPLTLKTKPSSGAVSPLDGVVLNGK